MAGVAVLRSLQALRPRTPAALSAPARSLLPASCALSPAWRNAGVRTLQLSSAWCAGHNKWSKVKNVKGPKDAARARMFTKLGMLIRIAVKDGGPNPDFNINLAHVLEQCRSKNMPKASIEIAIKSADKLKTGNQLLYEARGPSGCMLLIEVLTDNTTRTLQQLKRLLLKNGGVLSDGARNNFARKGVVAVQGQDINTERGLEVAIEVGAEDVQETEDEEEQPLLQFICDVTDLKKVRTSLEELGMKITSAGVEFVTHTPTSLDQNQLEAASTLIEALNDDPDVVRVWDNIQAQS
ncbi:translational activator of cytochrome c oxidase 1 [Genypterus blacodes]|uniref:translational activator of cytochrome c oxidase 1 n=1 Tax=Genypterus blacodes TaxID=154954 RepID=UPI003F76C95F